MQSKSDLGKFIKKYGYIVNEVLNSIQKINWEKVIQEFGGFEINNKLKKIFTSTVTSIDKPLPFYDIFDVPSGVIWNKSILFRIEFLKVIK